MADDFLFELAKAILEGLAWLGENFPDNPCLARKLLLSGGVLLSTVFIPNTSPELGDLILLLQVLCVIAGGPCLILGSFVFFRRWVWRRQDQRRPVIISLVLK